LFFNRKSTQRELQDKQELIESKKEAILSFKDEEEIDISSLAVMELIESINSLLEVHSKVSIKWWPVIQELHRLKDPYILGLGGNFEWQIFWRCSGWLSNIFPQVQERGMGEASPTSGNKRLYCFAFFRGYSRFEEKTNRCTKV